MFTCTMQECGCVPVHHVIIVKNEFGHLVLLYIEVRTLQNLSILMLMFPVSDAFG